MTRGSPSEYFGNWRASDAPLAKKAGTAVSNTLRRLTRRSTCCGHHGEPGC